MLPRQGHQRSTCRSPDANARCPPVSDPLSAPGWTNRGATLRAPALLALPPFCSGHQHVDVPADAPGADEPLAPLGNGDLGAEPRGHPGGIGLT
jgi:hypothetical protein